ncbi:hypothetical protein BT69DRAFT_1328430 [Atractiella rhizophila]|nr:hypothetical protein BT69DRAFT_1328430 [Atractiella rhizophila]
MTFAPPEGPPPPLPLNLPFCHPVDLARFHKRGWMPIDLAAVSLPDIPDVHEHFLQLFDLGKSFFNEPLSSKEAYDFSGVEGSEHGWSRVEGEKELLTVRSKESTPPVLASLRGVHTIKLERYRED